jgi:heme-degrading monooxygenase HmoA
MIALFFEVQPKPEHFQRYLDMAAALKPALEKINGFISIDRYKSLAREGVVLSHSIWRDEAALTAWRVHEGHHKAQDAGRNVVFADYRLRIAEVLREEQPGKPAWQPQRLSAYNDPVHRRPRYMVVAESSSPQLETQLGTLPGLQTEAYASLGRENEFVHVMDVPDLPVALELTDNYRVGAPAYRYRICEVERDYGMFERAEAPQYYPPVLKSGT